MVKERKNKINTNACARKAARKMPNKRERRANKDISKVRIQKRRSMHTKTHTPVCVGGTKQKHRRKLLSCCHGQQTKQTKHAGKKKQKEKRK